MIANVNEVRLITQMPKFWEVLNILWICLASPQLLYLSEYTSKVTFREADPHPLGHD